MCADNESQSSRREVDRLNANCGGDAGIFLESHVREARVRYVEADGPRELRVRIRCVLESNEQGDRAEHMPAANRCVPFGHEESDVRCVSAREACEVMRSMMASRLRSDACLLNT